MESVTALESNNLSNQCIVYIHGNSGSAIEYLDVLKADKLRNLNQVAVFIPGHGTGKRLESYTFENIINELAEEIQNRAQGKELIIYGHSFGGYAALEVAKKLKPKAVILNQAPPIDTFVDYAMIRKDLKNSGALFGELVSVEGIIELGKTIGAPDNFLECLTDDVLVSNRFRPEVVASMADYEASIGLNQKSFLKESQIPVYLISSLNDPIQHEVSEQYKDIVKETFMFHKSLHYPHLQETNKFIQVMSTISELVFENLDSVTAP